MGEQRIDSFTIGTPSTGGSIKVYFDMLDEEVVIKKIDLAIKYWKNSISISGKAR